MFDELVEIICNYVDVQPADVHEESRFMEDLGFTSFDFMSMLGEIEDTFDILQQFIRKSVKRLSRQRLQKSAQYRKLSIILRH